MITITEHIVDAVNHDLNVAGRRNLNNNEMEIRIYVPKRGVCLAGNQGHAAVRYAVAGQEYYLSLFPENLIDSCFGYCVGMPHKFRTLEDDIAAFVNIQMDEHTSAVSPSKYKGYYYQIKGVELNVAQFHEQLTAHLQSSIAAQFTPRRSKPWIPVVSNVGVPSKFFKYWANPCCCVPLGKHNCTSLVVAFLPEANLPSDLNRKAVACRLLSIAVWAISMGYLFSESVSINNPGKTIADEVFGIVGACLGSLGLLLYLSIYVCFPKRAKNFIAARSAPLLLRTTTAIGVGLLVALLALITFLIHVGTSSGADRINTIEKDDIDFIVLAAVTAGLFLFSFCWDLAQDRQNGCTNPYALKRMLSLASSSSVFANLNSAAPSAVSAREVDNVEQGVGLEVSPQAH